MKKILILGAGFLQAFVIQKARQMGYYTIAIDKNPHSVGFKYADDCGIVDIVDQKACLAFARSKAIDGVMTAATDYGVLSTAYIARQMGLPGIDYEAARLIKNKYQVRRILSGQESDCVTQFYQISITSKLLQIRDQLRYPVMIKPCDGSGSRAVQRIDNSFEFAGACAAAMQASLTDKALIEDFICGTEYGAESFVYDGEVYVLGILGKHMTSPPDYAELGHYLPSRLPAEAQVREVVRRSIKALGINFGAVNMDLLVTGDGRVCIIDVGARMGGNLIGSTIIPLGTGIDYMGNLIRAAVGDAVDLKPQAAGVSVATRLLALEPGQVFCLPNFNEIRRRCRVDIYHQLRVGDQIRAYHNNLDGYGYVVAAGDDAGEADKRAEEAKQLINKGIIREFTHPAAGAGYYEDALLA